MATTTRIYKVGDRLVRAAHPSNALMHVARDAYPVRVATQDDLETLIAQGVKVETIKAEQTELPNHLINGPAIASAASVESAQAHPSPHTPEQP